MLKVIFPDNSVHEFEKGSKILDVALSISEGFARNVLGAVIDDEKIQGLSEVLENDCKIKFVKFDDKEGKEIFWHTSSHLMALAIQRLFPDTKFGIGPAIDNGFYYDLDSEHKFTPEDLVKIEDEMKKIVKEGFSVERKEVSREYALNYFKEKNQDYKIDLIEGFDEDAKLSFYELGEFTDLCRGPHLVDIKKIKAFKLLSIAGAYWRGSEKNKMLQRIYGISFEKKKDLDEYLEFLEDAKQRDHRKIGKELGIFMISQNVGTGLPFWLPKGATIRRVVERYIVDKEIECGYNHVYTPILANVDLYKTSGHWDHYQDGMFPPMDLGNGEMLVLRPMNCPHHMEVYNNEVHSYKEFPIRIAELGMMHRYEMSGTLSGLQRVREMTLNDAHIFVRPDQIQEEFTRVVNLMKSVYDDFNITNYKFRLSYRDPKNKEKYFDDDKMWDNAETMLKKSMDDLGYEYFEAKGEAAFYGPKLDVQVKTAMGLEETLSTIQLDFLLPERFDLTYVGEDGKNTHRPVVIHRGVISTMERFIAYLIEEYKGAFPTWLAPEQVKILPISDKFNEYAYELKNILSKNDIRVTVDDRAEKIGFKIREAQLSKIPYSLVVGEKELEEKTVSVRKRGEGDKGSMKFDDFIQMILDEVQSKFIR
ncbi:MAG: threonine--tRNA ligase [Peptoniphilaceae bacterium]|uniref:threonine--tRNA ligase n=2 Tax=Parvimonas sp. TaxID=1944660 RepID=UPI002A74F0D6|nr:threonine--tRNA ligase [Parvimonas sp.]MDD7764507.1 threonine--tRNA ligase [Peptoniphilaceae bacterium]MDY3050486.1 threonine--tRNA ligase [Parvimonas sp.]